MTCLCLTISGVKVDGRMMNRRPWLPKAIRCFQSQTYPHRELLIVAEGDDVRDLVPNDDRIRIIHIDRCHTIGEKRNFACAHARGSVIAHFDDDDWSAADRVADQVERLDQSGKAVTGYTHMLFTDGESWWQWTGGKNPLGSSLCFRKDWWEKHPFNPKLVGEDYDFIITAKGQRELIAVDAERMMFASIHPGNTSPRSLSPESYRRVNAPEAVCV